LAGAVAEGVEARSITKYAGLLHTHSFTLVAVETLGLWGAETEKLLEELRSPELSRRTLRVSRTAKVTQEAYSKFFLRQQESDRSRLLACSAQSAGTWPHALVIQKGNALSILGTFSMETSALDVSFT